MKKILIITPHLSTGGLPQFLLDKIGVLMENYEVFLVEWSNITGGVLVVQRNKIIKLLPNNNFFTLEEDKNEIFNIIEIVNPDIIHFEEFSETFIDHSILNKVYTNRNYLITETTHGTSFDSSTKFYIPDKMLLVSKGNYNQYSSITSDVEMIEFPINFKKRTEGLMNLELDPNYKHVLNVGLFTPGKNQGEIFEIAKEFLNHNVLFHFVGNQAGNFIDYWQPLMDEKPDNCIIWGERTDTENFYKSMDLFLFTSKWENRPLSVIEAVSFKMPVLMRYLDNYGDTYSNYELIDFLTQDKETNIQKIKDILNV